MTNYTALAVSSHKDPFILDFVALKQSIITELKEVNGSYYCTIRGLSRLIGVGSSTLTDTRRQLNGAPMGLLLKLAECSVEKLPESLKPIAGFDYKNQPRISPTSNYVDVLLPEVVVACIVKYYAYDSNKPRQRAKQLDVLFASVGLRSFFADLLNQPTQSLSKLEAPTPQTEIEPLNLINDSTYTEAEHDLLERRAAIVKDFMQLFKHTSDEYKEKALLTLLGVI